MMLHHNINKFILHISIIEDMWRIRLPPMARAACRSRTASSTPTLARRRGVRRAQVRAYDIFIHMYMCTHTYVYMAHLSLSLSLCLSLSLSLSLSIYIYIYHMPTGRGVETWEFFTKELMPCCHTTLLISFSPRASESDSLLCMYVCIRMCVYVCVYIYIYTYIYIFLSLSLSLFLYLSIYIYIYTYICREREIDGYVIIIHYY